MNNGQQHGDEYTRQSFTFRGMKTWQLWSITVVSAAVIIALVIYGLA